MYLGEHKQRNDMKIVGGYLRRGRRQEEGEGEVGQQGFIQTELAVQIYENTTVIILIPHN